MFGATLTLNSTSQKNKSTPGWSTKTVMQSETDFRSGYSAEINIYSSCMGKTIPPPTMQLGPFLNRWPGGVSINHFMKLLTAWFQGSFLTSEKCRAHTGKWPKELPFLSLTYDLLSLWSLSSGTVVCRQQAGMPHLRAGWPFCAR